ncbi:uncharacterized protein N7469_000127 [Penicillium citrinum]|uniref:Uncharacterized protein n=1 Tax=Penicillium citrinum TaxID=5077 RepID=A0A9W9PC93_PENCI|nr:uncharacterized protein N7469_000127 [Penicillium citrinum]KAJ5241800.1 hypothetical protein N7469_000127 [Penicillium citrinum]
MGDSIAVDPDFYTMEEEAYQDDFNSETTSIASTIAKGVHLVDGNRYQAMKENDYCIYLTSAQVKDHGQLTWQIATHPQLFAVWISSLPPVTWMPPNCIFEVDDVLREWTWREPFDLIHLRILLGAFDDAGWDTLYRRCYDNLEVGGWIEQLEFDIRLYSDDGSLKEDSLLARWGDNFIACGKRAGRSLTTQETMKAAIEKAGFVDVHEHLYRLPLGPWAKNEVLKEAGRINYHHWSAGLEGYAMWLLTKFGAPEPWTTDEVHVYLASIRKELADSKTHAYQYVRRVWGRKPTEKETKAMEAEVKVKQEE